ncbi:TRAP transporter small permease, partial [Hoeflea sp. BAL378]|uniref:TRAP transporter small permease n=1 Tax=Hoeflea sp. BAL378 TaxID=1547437 RepID=UPI000689A6FE
TFSTLIGAAAVTLMMVQIILDVALRNLFQIPVPGTTAIVTSYYMLIVAYLPLAVAERTDSHIAVEVVSQLLGEKFQAWLLALTWLVSAVVAGTIAYALWLEALKAYSYGSFVIELNRSIPIWPGYFILPAGFGLYALVLAVRLGCAVTGTDEADAFGVPASAKGDLPVGEV